MQQHRVTTTKKSLIQNLDPFLLAALILFSIWLLFNLKWSLKDFPYEPLIGIVVTSGTLFANRYLKKSIQYRFSANFQNEYSQSVVLTNRSNEPQCVDIDALTLDGKVELLRDINLKPSSTRNVSKELINAITNEISKPNLLEIVIETKTVNNVIGVTVKILDKRDGNIKEEDVITT